jgi:hypothetical protein
VISVKVEGLEPILRTLRRYPSELDHILRPALQAGGVVLVGEQRRSVHKVTRKLAQAVGMTEQGQGAHVEVHVGLQPGLGTPRGYSESATGRWKTPRKGVNKGDPQVYGKYEEARHPFFIKSFVDKRSEVERAVMARAQQELQKRLRV